MKSFALATIVVFLVLVLAGCSGAPAEPPAAAPAGAAPEIAVPEASAPEVAAPQVAVPEVVDAGTSPDALDETLVDKQGAVAVAVTPRNIRAGTTTLDFEVVLDTHSVDLSMDLAELATLATDTGAQVAAIAWEAPSGGHHVSGVLSFPVESEGAGLLDGATTLTLTLENVDAPARTFTWSLN